ncbi:MAG: carboxylesterase family protein [Candidatus Izemoplasmatales bacterium]|nr:carboxylesterase family protein [Candidatus Izemoplasmatales bacterium]
MNKKLKKWLIVIISILLVLSIGVYTTLRVLFSQANQGGVQSDETIVTTTYGDLQGRVKNDVYNFLGVKYAKAEKLFQKAEILEPWEGVETAFEYGPVSLQQSFLAFGYQYSNDCQNLNIWTPEIHDDEKRPVMVWLHGGGFSSGNANQSDTNGENLALNEDVVIVSVNHRLNIVGYLDLTEYGSEYANSDNVGMDDILMALKWINNNIANFGGDPDNVTVFGYSGGGAKVLALMTMPEAKGLFHKAIVQSGATETVGVSFTSKEVSQALTEKVLNKLGISLDNIDDIQDVPYSDLMDAGNAAMQEIAVQYQIPGPFSGYGMEWEPVVDGVYMPTNPVTEDGFAEAGKDIPLLIGSTLNEWTRFISSERVDVTPEIEAAFAEAYPNEDITDAKYFDTLIRLPMLKIMSHKADQGGANVYSYIYSYGSSRHGSEIPYVFHNNKGDMNELMSGIWANFARTGIPSYEGIPDWEPYTRLSGACMILDLETYLDYHHDTELIGLIKPDYDY